MFRREQGRVRAFATHH